MRCCCSFKPVRPDPSIPQDRVRTAYRRAFPGFDTLAYPVLSLSKGQPERILFLAEQYCGLTADAIARELGLQGLVLTGAELDRIDDAGLSRRVEETAVFARVAPDHKVRIVQALKARGHVVAMTGDGVNDAPALKNADIGVAMGITGTEVTREAATMVLTDDNFATIVGAVKQGRIIHDNVVKFVRFQLSTNIGAILTVLGAQLLGLSAPFTAIHILWINIIMDGPPAMTLGLEPPRDGIMSEPPRRADQRTLSLARFKKLLMYGITMAVGTLALVSYAQPQGDTYALTLAFTTFVLFQLFNVFNARTEQGTTFNRQFFRNGKLWAALGGVLALQVLVVHWPPAQLVFDTTALSAMDWGAGVFSRLVDSVAGRSAEAERQTAAASPAQPFTRDVDTNLLLNQELLTHVFIGLAAVFINSVLGRRSSSTVQTPPSGVRMTSTGTGARRMICSAPLPKNMRPTRLRPCVPTTIRSAFQPCASAATVSPRRSPNLSISTVSAAMPAA